MQEAEANKPPYSKFRKVVLISLFGLLALLAGAYFLMSNRLGYSGPQSPSFETVKLKAAAGDPAYLHQLGKYYENGVKIPRSYEDALRCYSLASDGGDLDARYDYACLLASSKVGSLMDTEKAFKLLLDLAYRGNMSAQFSMALYHQKTKKDAYGRFDLIEAYAWANIFSAGMGVPSRYDRITYVYAGWSDNLPGMLSEYAFNVRNSIELEFSKEELSKAQKRSAEIFKVIEDNRQKK
jgi:hypothetical protein